MTKKLTVCLMLGALLFTAPLWAQQAQNTLPLSDRGLTPRVYSDLEQCAAAAAAEHQRVQQAQASEQVRTVWTCAFCGEPILHDHQKCSGHNNPFGICTHTDLNWGTPLHKGEYLDGREKTRYDVPFEPEQVTGLQKTVWTCAFCGEPILHDHQKCSGHDNPFGICTHTDLNWGTPLHKGVHHDGREKTRYDVPFEPKQVEVFLPQNASSHTASENNK